MAHKKALIAAYALIGVVAFGHSAASRDRWQAQHCASAEQRFDSNGECYLPSPPLALAAGVAWPLYWSWEVWS